MVCDYPDAYIGEPGFDFLQQVPTTWNETRVLAAKPSEYIAIARRKGKDWYIGAIANSSAQEINVKLDFLGEGTYSADIYRDAPDATVNANHLVKEIKHVSLTSDHKMLLAPGGGQVIHLSPMQP